VISLSCRSFAPRGAPGLAYEPHVVGNVAAQTILPWVHRIFSNRKTWALDAAFPKTGGWRSLCNKETRVEIK